MGKPRTSEKDFIILGSHLLLRKKTVYGYLYILEDEDEPKGRCFLFADYNKHSKCCSCQHRQEHKLCEHIKFIERTRRDIPSVPNPMSYYSRLISGSGYAVDESKIIDATAESLRDNSF